MCKDVHEVCFLVAEEGNPMVGGDIVRDDDVGVIIWSFVGSVWLIKLSSAHGGVSWLVKVEET